MSERRKLIEISYHSDDDTGIYHVGEIDWSVGVQLDEYVKYFGVKGIQELSDCFAYLSWYIRDIQHSLPEENPPSAAEGAPPE